ncbi:hypothetical protein HYW40_00470, partial [Candidatus Curtissbacteria bacterium]|nr:hypothetical protein [Candidatus Curtissbacteria bacterium]
MSSEERPSRTQKLDVDDKVIIDLREGWWLGRVISIEEAPPPWPERMISVIIDQDYTHNHQGAGES